MCSECEKALQREGAVPVPMEMEQEHVQPEIIAESALIGACEKGLRRECALTVLTVMMQEHLQQNM